MNKPTHEKIYLVPGDGIYCWSTTPAPGVQHESNDAVEYVRGDLFNSMQSHNEQLQAELLNWRRKSASQAVQIETLAKDIDAANDRNAELVEQRDALAAQNELLRKLWNAAQPDIVRLFEIQPFFGDNEKEIDGQACHELQQAFALTPQQCLLDVQAEAGLKGYLEAALNFDPDYDAWWSADQYAESVRQGGAE